MFLFLINSNFSSIYSLYSALSSLFSFYSLFWNSLVFYFSKAMLKEEVNFLRAKVFFLSGVLFENTRNYDMLPESFFFCCLFLFILIFVISIHVYFLGFIQYFLILVFFFCPFYKLFGVGLWGNLRTLWRGYFWWLLFVFDSILLN